MGEYRGNRPPAPKGYAEAMMLAKYVAEKIPEMPETASDQTVGLPHKSNVPELSEADVQALLTFGDQLVSDGVLTAKQVSTLRTFTGDFHIERQVAEQRRAQVEALESALAGGEDSFDAAFSALIAYGAGAARSLLEKAGDQISPALNEAMQKALSLHDEKRRQEKRAHDEGSVKGYRKKYGGDVDHTIMEGAEDDAAARRVEVVQRIAQMPEKAPPAAATAQTSTGSSGGQQSQAGDAKGGMVRSLLRRLRRR